MATMTNEARERREQKRTRQGLAWIAALTLVGIGVFFVDIAIRATSEGDRIIVLAPSATGLQPGAAVWVAGRPVGRVLDVGLRPPREEGEDVIITAVVDRAAEAVLRTDATAEVRASDLLEPVIVAIDPGVAATAWRRGDTLRGPRRSIDRDSLLAYADALLGAGRALAAETGRLREALAEGGGSLAPLLENREVVAGWNDALGRFREAATRDLPRSSVVRLARDTTVREALRRIRGRLVSLRDSPERERAGEALRAALAAIDAAGDRLEGLMASLDAGYGTAGRALTDGELREQLDALRAQLETLARELARDPSRWLRVRIF